MIFLEKLCSPKTSKLVSGGFFIKLRKKIFNSVFTKNSPHTYGISSESLNLKIVHVIGL